METLIAVSLLVVLVVVVVSTQLPSILRVLNARTVHLKVTTAYSGSWNGSLSYGSPCPGRSGGMQWSGTGSEEKDVIFQGDWNTGFGYYIHIGKGDNSTGVLNVTVASDVLGRYTNSTAAPYGFVEFGSCAIS